MQYIRLLCLVVGAVLFLFSAAAFLYVKIKLKPGQSLDDVYWELEENHPDLARYNKWTRITFSGVVIGIILLFLVIAI